VQLIPPRSSQVHRPNLARATFAGVALCTAVLIVWFIWTGTSTRDAFRTASQKAVRVAELRGTIAYLDEWLTMSARMTAATGELRWAERYKEVGPKLDAALAEADAIATPDVRAAMAGTTAEAHRDLVIMEQRSISLAAEGNLSAARALLDSPEFAYIKDVYATGVEIFGQELTTLAEQRATALNDRAMLEVTGLGLSTVLLTSTLLAFRGRAQLTEALAQTAAVARTDALTDLPNRRRFHEELETALASLPGSGGSLALLLVDLDRFKAVNDAYGHLAGDRLLRLVADRLKAILEPGEVIARLGGDEFALLLTLDASEGPHASSRHTTAAERIVAALKQPFDLPDTAAVLIGGSVGIAVAEPCGGIPELLHRADIALYQAKADGRACFRFFEEGMDAVARTRARLEGELRQAVADDEIMPHFQPLVAIDTGHIVGAEMLARWPHPVRGMVSPTEFIPLAEGLGLIGPMTERLLRKACSAAAHWPAHITLACNLSPLQLRDPELPAMVARILDDTGFPARRLELEITESALVGDLALAATLLGQLKALGVRLALDDFGTGCSSLRHLRALPFDKLKIDASFVGAMESDAESSKIVAAVVGLGHSLGLTTVAEGVETPETVALLMRLGCDIGQGWLFGRPAPAKAFEALLALEKAPNSPATRSAA
jgi:diguanylate cyclase (GGDEF)-like protein